ncbi:hypothetical protein Tco_0888094 [Tanacetum coccineum]
MASHRSKSLYAIKECSTCGRLYNRECCSIRSFEDKILVPKPDSSPRCARCGTPVDGPSCRGFAFLRKKFDEDLLAYCVEYGIFKDFQDTFESSDDNTNVVNALREPCVVNQDPGVKFSQDPPQIDHNCAHYGYNCPPKDPIISKPEPCNQAINEIPQTLPSLDPSCYSLPHVSKPNFEKAYEDEKYSAACRYMLSVTCDDEDDYIPLAITTDLPIEEPDNSLKMGDEHLDTIPAMESDEVIKSSVENLVPIPSEFEGISDDTSDVPTYDNNCVNIESELVESLSNRDTSIVYSSKIDPILKEFAGELTHIAPIPPGIVETDFDPNDDTSSDDDSFENIKYVDASPSFSELDSLEEENEDQEEKEFDLEDIFQIKDVILREKLLNVHCLISNIESLKDNPTPDRVLESPSPFPIPVADSDSSVTSLSFSNNSLPKFESFSDHTEETRSCSTITHANYFLPEYESFHFDNLSLPRPPPEPPDVCLDMFYNDETFEPGEDENIVVSNVEENDSFTFTIHTFLPFLTYPEVSPLSCSTGSEYLIFDPGIITFHFLKSLAFLWKFLSSIFAFPKDN